MPTASSDKTAELFAHYLNAEGDGAQPHGRFVNALRAAGYECEAAGIEAFASGKSAVRVPDGAWAGEMATVGLMLPSAPRAGDLWVDVLTATPMTYIESSEAPGPALGRWISARPVKGWQFEAFRLLVKLGGSRTEFPAADDYLARKTVADHNDFASDIYHDEALAFAHWFGESLASQTDWQDARDTLTPAKFAALLPEGRLAWNEAEFALSEFARTAFGVVTVDKDPVEEADDRAEEANVGLADRVVFEEWEKSSLIGLSLRMRANRPRRIPATPTTLFFDLGNSAGQKLESLRAG